ACQIGTCNGGFYNVDGQSSTGCECSQGNYPGSTSVSAAQDLGTYADVGGSSGSFQFRIIPWNATDGHNEKWFKFTATDGTDFGSDSFHVAVTVSGLPGNNYRLTVYRGAPPGNSGIGGSTCCCGFLCFGNCSVPANLSATSNGGSSMGVSGWDD